MKRALIDRADVLNASGSRQLSPALRAGGPVFAAHREQVEGLVRCGWTAFFEALAAQRLTVIEDDEAGTLNVMPEAEARPFEPHHSVGASIKHALQFVTELRSVKT